MICTIKELLEEAEKNDRAVGGFNVANMESLMGVIQAAEEMKTSVILQIAEKRMEHSPLEYIAPMMVEAAKTAKVKVAVQLDHGKTVKVIKKTLEYGFTSIMFDGSDYPLSENIRLTNQVAEIVSGYKASMEAELGVVGGNEGDGECRIRYTDPSEAIDFASEAKIDALAVAIGNSHGHYKGIPKLNFEILKKIAGRVEVPLVLHGGTGITDEQFCESIRCGIRKINIATANFDAMTQGAADYLLSSKAINYFDMNNQMVRSVCSNVKRYIEVFNNSAKPKNIG